MWRISEIKADDYVRFEAVPQPPQTIVEEALRQRVVALALDWGISDDQEMVIAFLTDNEIYAPKLISLGWHIKYYQDEYEGVIIYSLVFMKWVDD